MTVVKLQLVFLGHWSLSALSCSEDLVGSLEAHTEAKVKFAAKRNSVVTLLLAMDNPAAALANLTVLPQQLDKHRGMVGVVF